MPMPRVKDVDAWAARRAASTQRSRARRMARLQALKIRHGCMDCGYREHAEALDFDHRPDQEKLFNIAQAPYRPWAIMEAELEKCDVVCANCHRVRTASRRS